ncbi:hypothetical protein D7X33_19035 [Butyricicoccus sp. 1XD8-22]|nr:hypothetical protein D7X33_19035 [Butyricicoccus sp. 1XD8-22]
MSTVIHNHAMPEALRTLSESLLTGSAQRPSSGMGFFDLAVLETAKKEGEGADHGVSTDDMSLQQYKKYISGRISAIPVDPSRALESLAVRISDEGFEAMKADPDYEKWVLEKLTTAWAQPKPLGVGGYAGYTTYSVGADEDSFRTTSVDLGDDKGSLADQLKKDEGETFWERRHRHHEEYMELAQRQAFLRRLRNGSVSAAELLLSGL